MPRFFRIMLGFMAVCVFFEAFAEQPVRPRLLVLTDIGGDPDDQQSLVRLMVYANHFRIEGLIASASGTPGELKESVTRTDLIRQTIQAYGAVIPNLSRHETGWPTEAALASKIKSGNPLRGREQIGEGHDTEGSRWIIECINKATPQDPLNITIWGGQTDLAQALWSIQTHSTSEEFKTVTGKFRVYDIADQDSIADWMRLTFPGMFYILNKAPEGNDKREATFRGMYLGGDESLTSREWIDKHIRSKGPLGALYPTKTWTAPNPHGCMKEGDTPSWFFFQTKGGNLPHDPTQPGWGGQFRKTDDGWYQDLDSSEVHPRSTVHRWRPDFQKDFALRMSWCVAQ
ncbi:MAG: DUF1593 domain-containing protein [Verrucomicrobiota bacterium]